MNGSVVISIVIYLMMAGYCCSTAMASIYVNNCFQSDKDPSAFFYFAFTADSDSKFQVSAKRYASDGFPADFQRIDGAAAKRGFENIEYVPVDFSETKSAFKVNDEKNGQSGESEIDTNEAKLPGGLLYLLLGLALLFLLVGNFDPFQSSDQRKGKK